MKDKFQMVGEKLIDFKLPTSRNKMFSTESLRNKKNMVIVLLRGIK
jgi:peroxiredoxin